MKNKQTETKTPSSGGHELISAHFNLLVIPAWFLLLDGLSLLNWRLNSNLKWRLNSLRHYQAPRAAGKWVTLPSDVELLVEARALNRAHQESHRRCSITTLGQREELKSSELGDIPQPTPAELLVQERATQSPSDLAHELSLFCVRLFSQNPRIISVGKGLQGYRVQPLSDFLRLLHLSATSFLFPSSVLMKMGAHKEESHRALAHSTESQNS